MIFNLTACLSELGRQGRARPEFIMMRGFRKFRAVLLCVVR